MRWFVVFAGITACRVPDLQLTGKQSPCPTGWYCDQTSTCVSGAEPDAGNDASNDSAATTYRDAVIADAPLGYWRLGDSGNTAHDEMGNYDGVYSGTCMFGAPGAIADDANAAVVFDGSSCEITLPNQLAFLATAPYSVEAWIDKPAAVSGFRAIFAKESRGVTGPVDGYALVDSSTGGYFERAVAQTAPTTPHVTLPANQYVHLVGVYDGTELV